MTIGIESAGRSIDNPRSDVWEYRLAFGATFLVMLVPAALSRLSLGYWSGQRPRVSILREAGARTDRILPFFFMS
jgi:hypothetical protein